MKKKFDFSAEMSEVESIKTTPKNEYLEGGTRFEKAKKLRDLYPLDTMNGQRIWVEFLNRTQWCQNGNSFVV